MLAASPGYGPILVLIVVAIVMSTAVIIITHVLPKAKRHGVVKESTYECGMEVIGDARRRFNVRFYLVAMLFLLFDVELVFMYPWAKVFTQGAALASEAPEAVAAQQFLFVEMGVFFAILLVGYTYAWRKGVFNWD